MKSLWYLIYYTHLYTFFFTVIQKKRFACLKLLKNVQSEPKLNSFLKLDKKGHRDPFIVVLYML